MFEDHVGVEISLQLGLVRTQGTTELWILVALVSLVSSKGDSVFVPTATAAEEHLLTFFFWN
jgi:hypothetical protein